MVEKITPAEFDSLALHGRGRSSPVFNALLALHVGEALVIKKTEWNAHYSPTLIVKRIEKKYGMRFKRGALPDRTGWAVKRLS